MRTLLVGSFKLRTVIGLILSILGCNFPAKGADGFWLLSTEQGLAGQKDWNFYNANDAPEGAYMGWLFPGNTNLVGNIPLRRELPPGDYYITLKVITYSSGGKIQVELGDGKSVADAINSDWNKYWTVPVKITATTPVTSLVLRPIKTIAIEQAQKYLVRGVYITPNPNENVPLYGEDRVINYSLPGVTNAPSSLKENIFENSSFEVGIGHGWGFAAEGAVRPLSLQEMWDTNVAFHGSASFRFSSKSSRLTSRTYNLRANRFHTFSAWIKSSGPSGAGLRIFNAGTPPPGFPSVVDTNKAFFNINTNWQRVQLTAFLPSYPSSQYHFEISGNSNVWVDCIQLEEGKGSNFAPTAPVEASFQSSLPGRVLYAEESPSLDLLVRNHSQTNRSEVISYEVFDLFNLKVQNGDISVELPPLNTTRSALTLNPAKTGIFRVVSWVKGINNTVDEVVFSVVQKPRTLGTNENSMIGTHPNFVRFQLATLQRLGFKWARALSPEGIFRWQSIEPVEGQIRWNDEKVDRVAPYGMTIMGTIGSNREWPAWADVNGMPHLDKWESFVERLVAHYKGKVKYWEIWNEPIYTFTPEQYTPLLQRAALAIRRADPDAKIVAMGGVYSRTYIVKVMELLGADWKQSVDFVATHLYPPNTDPSGGEAEDRAVEFKKMVIDRWGVEVWNTETGVWDEGFYKTANSNFEPIGDAMLPYLDADRYVHGCYYEPERMLQNFIHCVGNGMTKYFYYDTRIYASPSYSRSHPTMLEYDDSIRSKGIALSTAGWFLDGSRGLGGISANTNTTFAYLFEKTNEVVVALWAKDKLNHTIQLDANWAAFDLMGNHVPMTNGLLRFGRTHMYLTSSVSTAVASNTFKTATIANVADNNAPNVSIDEFPSGPVTTLPFTIRWLGIDETVVPSATEPTAVSYSYRLAGFSEWSEWTPDIFKKFDNVPSGTYTFQVRGRDSAGNVGEIVSREIEVSQYKPKPPSLLRALDPTT